MNLALTPKSPRLSCLIAKGKISLATSSMELVSENLLVLFELMFFLQNVICQLKSGTKLLVSCISKDLRPHAKSDRVCNMPLTIIQSKECHFDH